MHQDIAYIKQHQDTLFAALHPIAFMNVEENVPPIMRKGDVEESGWVGWNPVPSTIGETEIAELEHNIGAAFPPLYRAWLMTSHYVSLSLTNERAYGTYGGDCRFVDMPAYSTEDKLEPLKDLIEAWKPLVSAGYLPFAECEDGQGPVCFDMQRRQPDGDCPVVWFLHDHLHEIGEEESSVRASVQPFEKELFSSFREMVRELCTVREAGEESGEV